MTEKRRQNLQRTKIIEFDFKHQDSNYYSNEKITSMPFQHQNFAIEANDLVNHGLVQNIQEKSAITHFPRPRSACSEANINSVREDVDEELSTSIPKRSNLLSFGVIATHIEDMLDIFP